MRAIALALLASFWVFVHANAYAWGSHGHEVLGEVADRLLSPQAALQVERILGPDIRTLSAASTWADCAKGVVRDRNGQFRYQPDSRHRSSSCEVFETPAEQARMEDYVGRNWKESCGAAADAAPCHKQYHYADVAIQHDHYDRAYFGTSDHDIVGVINASIEILEGRPTPAPFSIRDKKEALLLLAHFVGDIHQPLHVGAIYVDSHDHLFDPDAAGAGHDKDIETHGGNSIEDGSTNLHAEWDNVSSAMSSDKLLQCAQSQPITKGDVKTWAEKWASETIVQAQAAFDGIGLAHNGAEKEGDWVAEFADRPAYLKTKNAMQKAQICKAGARLAQLLEQILSTQNQVIVDRE